VQVQIRSLGDQLSGPTSSLRTGQCIFIGNNCPKITFFGVFLGERGVEGYSFESDNWVKGNQQVAGKKRRHENGGGDANGICFYFLLGLNLFE
jgi:hypothetical protein